MLGPYKVVAAAIAFLLSLGFNAKEPEFAVVDSSYGLDSQIVAPRVVVVSNQGAWDRLWAEHKGTIGSNLPGTIKLADDRPPIDFNRFFVLAAFGGVTHEIEGYSIAKIEGDEKKAIIRIARIERPNPPLDAPRLTQPFGFFILPKSRRTMEIQVQDENGRWFSFANFPATREKAKGTSLQNR